MIIEIDLDECVYIFFKYVFSLSREKENQKIKRGISLEISGGEGMNDIEKQSLYTEGL